MILSVASGKGGTGKTTVATSLAFLFPDSMYLDCDVEEPNGHILLKPAFIEESPSVKMLPAIDNVKCTICRKCVETCEFNALLCLVDEIILIDEMCHGCGACAYLCPEKAIVEIPRTIGFIRQGISRINKSDFVDGVLNIGEASAAPLIRAVKRKIVKDTLTIIDAPPGTSCSMVEAVRDSDYCILVTESNPFGLHDLQLAVEVLKILNIPFGVIINKYEKSFVDTEDYLSAYKIPLLMKIPFDWKIANDYSNGIIAAQSSNFLINEFEVVIKQITASIAI
jgi:MinD superfamily P-loop ATPase